jgi:hypothetical protein
VIQQHILQQQLMSEAESAEQHSGSAGLEFWLKSPYNYIVDQLVQAGHLAPDWAARVFTAEDAGSLFLSIMQAVINDNGRIEDMLQTERSKNTALQAHNQSLEAMCSTFSAQQLYQQVDQAAAAQLQKLPVCCAGTLARP